MSNRNSDALRLSDAFATLERVDDVQALEELAVVVEIHEVGREALKHVVLDLVLDAI